MIGLVRTLITLAVLGALAWCGATVPLGSRTFFGHVKNIWSADETKELVDGVKKKSGPVVDRVKRGVEAGMASEPDGGSEKQAEGDKSGAGGDGDTRGDGEEG